MQELVKLHQFFSIKLVQTTMEYPHGAEVLELGSGFFSVASYCAL